MSKFCPYRNGPALYTDCIECDDKACENKVDVLAYLGNDGELVVLVPPDVHVKSARVMKKHRLS